MTQRRSGQCGSGKEASRGFSGKGGFSRRPIPRRRVAAACALLAAALVSAGGGALFGMCGPFADVAADSFCPFVLEIFALGITSGTTPTTYAPGDPVTRLQMAAFLSRTVDGVLKRSSRRSVSEQFWTPQSAGAVSSITIGTDAGLIACDGADVWVSSPFDGAVARVRASDGRLLETWTGAGIAGAVLAAMDGVFITGVLSPGQLYRIRASQAPGAVTTVSSSLGSYPAGIAFDGGRIWTTNQGPPGSVSIVLPGTFLPWTATTVTAGFSTPFGILYDGSSVWVEDDGVLLRLNASGAILQTVTVGPGSGFPAFDGMNIWVPNYAGASVSVVRASSGAVLATLTGSGRPSGAAFDGQRVLVTNDTADSVSLWRAADLTPLGTSSVGTSLQRPWGVCSDGQNFWVAMRFTGKLTRF